MALWVMECDGDHVKLRWSASCLEEKAAFQTCGRMPAGGRSALEAWVCEEAAPFDMVRDEAGLTFVKQVMYGHQRARA